MILGSASKYDTIIASKDYLELVTKYGIKLGYSLVKIILKYFSKMTH